MKRDIPVQTPDECVCRKKSHRSRQKTINNASEEAIAEEKRAGDEPLNMQSSSIIPDAVDKHPECAAAAHEETLPPPMVVLDAGQLDSFQHRDRRWLTSVHS